MDVRLELAAGPEVEHVADVHEDGIFDDGSINPFELLR